MSDRHDVRVAGAGIIGLWHALVLARAGHRVCLVERSVTPFRDCASRYAGAMLAPYCEAESAPAIVRDLGAAGLAAWRREYPGVLGNGSLVLAPPREPGELVRFQRTTSHGTMLDAAGLRALEPELADRFDRAVYFADEAHMAVPDALAALLDAVKRAGAHVVTGADGCEGIGEGTWLVDCRGLAASGDVASLRGVRGERVVVRAPDVRLLRPVRLLHPRVPLYIVPWPDNIYMIGATVIESEDNGPVSVRSAIELLGAATLVHAGFAEASILELGAGVRPALPDNVPRVVVDGPRLLRANGAYRHGFLLAPMLAEATRGIMAGEPDGPLVARPAGPAVARSAAALAIDA